jgi:hypothetical protein
LETFGVAEASIAAAAVVEVEANIVMRRVLDSVDIIS